MKKDRIKEIIREELDSLKKEDPFNKAMDKYKERLGVTPGTGNTMGLPLEKLQKYIDLADTEAEADNIMGKYVYLPSISHFDSSTKIFSKEKAKEWLDQFIEKYNEVPKFKLNGGGSPEIINVEAYQNDKRKEQQNISNFYEGKNIGD